MTEAERLTLMLPRLQLEYSAAQEALGAAQFQRRTANTTDFHVLTILDDRVRKAEIEVQRVYSDIAAAQLKLAQTQNQGHDI